MSRNAALRFVLHQARDGALEKDWRERTPKRLAEQSLWSAEDEDQDGGARRELVSEAHALAELPPQDWEPHSGAGWRRALETWFARTMDCLEADAHAERELAEVFPELNLPSMAAMDTDQAIASYRAGLMAGGLPADEWYHWLLRRVEAWPDEGMRHAQLTLMTEEPSYRDSIEQLPTYWTSVVG